MKKTLRITSLCIASFHLGSILGCNAFSIVDPPSGDVEILDAARGCFDQGNYTCASQYYSQLSTASSDQANSEFAFEILAQNGITINIFMNAVISGTSNIGTLVTSLANALVANAGQTTRLNIFHAYQKMNLINNKNTQGLVQFITALSLTSEILAEAATGGSLHKTDLAINPTACIASVPAFTAAYCDGPPGTKLTSGPALITLSTATDSQMSGSPNLHMVLAAIQEVNKGISSMQANGTLGSSTSTFAQAINAAGSSLGVDPADSPVFREALVNLGIGG